MTVAAPASGNVDEVIDKLRRAVLPARSTELASRGLRAAVCYRPAEPAGVGGDWYKTRLLPGGDLLLAIADARGHGLDAVALAAKLRYALAGLAFTGAPVARLAGWLNEVAYDDGAESTTTAVVARYQPDQRLLRWVNAGHFAPVLVRDGTAAPLQAPVGPPLGVLPETRYEPAVVRLRRGDVLLLHTDGVVESRRSDVAERQDALRTAAVRRAPADLDRYAAALADAVVPGDAEDDATILAVRVE